MPAIVAALNLRPPAMRRYLCVSFVSFTAKDDMIPFVLSTIRKKGLMSWLYVAVNVIGLSGIGIYSIWGFCTGWINWSGFIIQLLLGIFAGSLIIIPFHELLHGLAYKILGAKKIQFGANLQQFFFCRFVLICASHTDSAATYAGEYFPYFSDPSLCNLQNFYLCFSGLSYMPHPQILL